MINFTEKSFMTETRITLGAKEEAALETAKSFPPDEKDFDVRHCKASKTGESDKIVDSGIALSIEDAKNDILVIETKGEGAQFSVPPTVGTEAPGDPNFRPPHIRAEGSHPLTAAITPHKIGNTVISGGGGFVLDGKGNMTLRFNAPDGTSRAVVVERGAELHIVSPKDGKTALTLSNKDEKAAEQSVANYNAFKEKNGNKPLSLHDAPDDALKSALAAAGNIHRQDAGHAQQGNKATPQIAVAAGQDNTRAL